MTHLNSELIDRFYLAILALKTPEECAVFFEGLRTVTEIQNMAQRPEVAQLPADCRNYQEITNGAGVSAATISRVNRAIKDGCDGYQIIFDRTESPEPPKE